MEREKMRMLAGPLFELFVPSVSGTRSRALGAASSTCVALTWESILSVSSSQSHLFLDLHCRSSFLVLFGPSFCFDADDPHRWSRASVFCTNVVKSLRRYPTYWHSSPPSAQFMENAQQVSEVVALARLVVVSTSDRDTLDVSHAELLTRQSIQKAFQRRALCLHPDKTPAVDSDDARTIGAAFGKLTEARARLLDLLPLVQLLWQVAPMPSPPSSSGGGAGSTAACYGASPSSHTHVLLKSASEDIAAPSIVASPSVLSASSFPFSSTKCRTFGCLRSLTAEDVQVQHNVCLHCRTQPKKCAVFGCLRMVGGDAYCSHHLA